MGSTSDINTILNLQQNTESSTKKRYILSTDSLRKYIDRFNRYDIELYRNLFPNTVAFDFLQNNIPLIDIPDKTIEEIYYFRWWTYRKHIAQAADNPSIYLITEFLPVVSWSGRYNTINCAAGHHFREGRWLHDTKYLESYSRLWFSKMEGVNPRQYSFWPANAVWAFYRITGLRDIIKALFPEFLMHLRIMIRTNYDTNMRLFFNTDNRDGMELSAGGGDGSRGYRPTLNSYMAAEAKLLSKMARFLDLDNQTAEEMFHFSKDVIYRMEETLWDKKDNFFKVCPFKRKMNRNDTNIALVSVRELHGYTPWYFNLIERSKHLKAWEKIVDKTGFHAPYGLTTAEQSHSGFKLEYSRSHECRWNGPSWPYATSITLTAMANILQDLKQNLAGHERYLSKEVYYNLLETYARAHHRNVPIDELPADSTSVKTDGSYHEPATHMVLPWIDENIHPYTGDWISRTLLSKWQNNTWSAKKGGRERGKDYNHSTFIDLILSGLLGFYPRSETSFELRPLIPSGKLCSLQYCAAVTH